MKKSIFFVMIFIGFALKAQTTFVGSILDENRLPIPLANISLNGQDIGTVTDFNGVFTLTTQEELPVTINVSCIGYQSKTVEVTTATEIVKVILSEGTELDVVVISASRAPERIFESPVSIEYYGAKEIKNTPSADFYTGLENLKGVDVNTNSLAYKTVNTRGYGSFSNARFVQLIDGTDNASPALSYSLGNLVGISELDVSNIELLPGASSALYGANAFNGILFINSKNPFDNEGVSAYLKTGVTSQEAAGANLYYDFALRAAKAFSDKFAAKFNVSYFQGTDWWATSEDNINNPGLTRDQDPNYDGLNIYGDEITQNMRNVGLALLQAGQITQQEFEAIPEGQNVSRTGYAEKDLLDYDTESLKFNASLHYRPFADDLEIIYDGRIGRGTTIFQNANRFSSPDFFLQQHKLEVKNDNFFVRGYITDQDAGDLYDTRIAAININKRWKSDNDWFGQYVGAYARIAATGAAEDQAHLQARNFANTGRLEPGTPGFQEVFDEVISTPDFTRGAKFRDESSFTHVDANYNFAHLMPEIADVQVGGSFRQYKLQSFGSVFTDADGPIRYSELGAYLQVQKLLVDERLKFTGSVRYDKSELFDGNFSPRISVGYSLGEDRNHNIRASVQTGFRNPTAQNVYMGLDIARAITVGTAQDNPARDIRTYRLNANGQEIQLSAQDALDNSFTLSSFADFAQTGFADPSTLKKSDVSNVRPEEVTAFEVGYRGKYDRVSAEITGYYNIYNNFISGENVLVPLYGEVQDGEIAASQESLNALGTNDFKIYNFATNSEEEVRSYGVIAGANAKIFGNYDLGVNYTFMQEDFDNTADFNTEFNAPEHRLKATFGNTNVFQNFGFNTSVKWNSEYVWNDSFGSVDIPSFTIFDAQVNYRIPSLKTIIRLGGTNIGGQEYFNGTATGLIGSLYYVGLTINNL